MTKRQGRLVQNQHTGVGHGDENSYTNYTSLHAGHETTFGNPDQLVDEDANKIWGLGTKPELAELLIERYMDEEGNFPTLTKKENEVLRLYTATGNVVMVAKSTGIKRTQVYTYLARIRGKLKKLVVSLDL